MHTSLKVLSLIALRAAAAMLVAGTAHSQMYECRSATTPGQVYQQNAPCAPGMNARQTPEEASRLKKAEAEERLRMQNNDNEFSVMRREVSLGMTANQVQRSWGNPHRVVTEESASGGAERWIYNCPRVRGTQPVTTRVYFRKGQVTKISRAC